MRRIKFLGLVAVVLVAALGVLAATASAETKPEWFVCAKGVKNGEKKYTGKYTTKTCSPEASPTEIAEGKKNKYELQAGVGKAKAFKGKGAAASLEVETPFGNFPIKCGSSATGGTPAMPNLETNVNFAFKKCEFTGQSCKTPGGKKGEITGSGLDGELGYVKPETGPGPAVGLKIINPGGEAEPLGKFECGEGETKGFIKESSLLGAVIGVQEGDVNTISKEATLTYKALPQYGVHEFASQKYTPLVNIIGYESEVAEIEACSGLECAETEHPAHVIRGVFCGSFIVGILGEECTPPTYAGLNAKDALKGEALMIKA